ncbi:MAG: sialate O-acetylesterase [Verrucomicrobiota bacterium]
MIALWVANSGGAFAAVKPHGLIADGAVLQQGMEVPVWGSANDSEQVTVKFQDQTVAATARAGRWLVKLKPLKPGGPFTMTITGENTVEVKDLLVGEVWVCSGQSNMEFRLKNDANASAASAAANDPLLRVIALGANFQAEPQRDVTAQWVVCTPTNAPTFTAVGYYFGRDLRKALNVPVGLIHSSVGGTPAQAWTSPAALRANPQFNDFFVGHENSIRTYYVALAKFKAAEPQLREQWQAAVAQAKSAGKPEPRPPVEPPNPTNRGPGCLYNGMIAPLLPSAIRGVIWYQGESNVSNPFQYQTLFPTLIKDWRTAWGQGEFPFLFVQVAPYHTMTPELREAQLRCWQTTPKTAMVVITDCGSATNIHPPRKEPVGQRLALAARAIAYGEKIEYSGPIYESMKVNGNQIVLNFQHTGTGLIAKDGDLRGFTIAGANKTFTNATAKIEGVQVVVSSPAVAQPVAVRYGWTNVPDVNLYNKEGLPASQFRTDLP